MAINTSRYLIDANSLMTAARLFYAYDIVPSFWDIIEKEFKSGNIIILDMVKAEIDKGQDKLKEWLERRKDDFKICGHIDADIISKYADIMQYIQECGFYNDKGLSAWAENDVADPWLVATAAAKDYKLITFEQSAGMLSEKNKTGKVKIPDVADHFNVEVHNLYYMMRELNIKI